MLHMTTTEELDTEALLTLVRQNDPLGVLSIYVDAQPGGPGARSRGAGIDIRNRLAELESRIRSDGPPERAVAVSDRLERLVPDIERLVDPRETGRGRVLFVPLSEDRLTRFSSRLSVPNRVVLDSSAFVHPLLELLDEGRPTGVVVASRSEGNLLEWRLGELRWLRRLTPDAPEASHERSGPVAPNPGGAHTSPRREQRQARERNQLQRFVEQMAAAASQEAGERGWERVLVSGGETLTEPLAQALPRTLRTIRDPRMLAQLDPSELVRAVTDRLRSEHREHGLRLVDSMRETALGGGAAALGLSEVSAALNEGRVLHLAYDPAVRYEGSVDSDGMLYAEGEAPASADGLLHEPRLTERLVERGLETGARLTPVEGGSLAALAAAGGIGAWLRW